MFGAFGLLIAIAISFLAKKLVVAIAMKVGVSSYFWHTPLYFGYVGILSVVLLAITAHATGLGAKIDTATFIALHCAGFICGCATAVKP